MASGRACTEEKRKANGYCRYFVRGDCREGNDCKYSHDIADVPVCRYWMEGRCLFGVNCWYKHYDEELVPILDPTAVILGAGVRCGYESNLNLLLAAAVASAPSLDDSEEEGDYAEDSDEEELSVDKAVEMWINRKNGFLEDGTAKSPETVDGNKTELGSGSDEQDSFESREEDIDNYFAALRKYNTRAWSVEAAYQMITTLAELDIKEYDQYDVQSSRVLGEFFRCWKPDTTKSSELFMKVVEKCDADIVALILTLCNAPSRVRSLESHVAAMLLAAKARDPPQWSHEALAAALKTVEYSDFNVDLARVFSAMGKETFDSEQLGMLVREYLVITGEKDSFTCRCKTPECECEVQVDEGIAYMLFENLEKKMDWGKDDKCKFFKGAADRLWTADILVEIGESLGIKDPLKVTVPRPSANSNNKLAEEESSVAAVEGISIMKHKKGKNSQKKTCLGERCSNQAKRDCDNDMCKKCCRRSGDPCEAHEDPLDVFKPPSYESDFRFYKVEPKAFLKTKSDLEELVSSRKQLRCVEFGIDFEIHDEDLVTVVDKWKDNLVVLELGSSDTGDGVRLTDNAVRYIADNCCKLRKLRLESVTHASDDAVMDIMRNCPLLEHLEVTGHDKSSGALSDKSLKVLFNPDILPNLKLLCITDQWNISRDVVYRLRRRRPNLKIIAGETDSDSMAWSMVMGMMGRDYGDGLF